MLHESTPIAGKLCEAHLRRLCIAAPNMPVFGARETLQCCRLVQGSGQERVVEDDGPCLVVTESQENSAKFLYVLRRWLPLTLFIRGVQYLHSSKLYMLS